MPTTVAIDHKANDCKPGTSFINCPVPPDLAAKVADIAARSIANTIEQANPGNPLFVRVKLECSLDLMMPPTKLEVAGEGEGDEGATDAAATNPDAEPKK